MGLLFKEIEEVFSGKEIFHLEIKGRAIEVEHQGNQSFSQQSEKANIDLEKVIKEFMDKGDSSGFIPYNNFECSIRWRAI